VQRLGEPSFGGDEGCVALHPVRQGFEGLAVGRQDRRGLRAGVDFAAEDGCDQVRALRKVSVKGAEADAKRISDPY
jgi:hypothetical protein